MNFKFRLLIILIGALTFSSCQKKEDIEEKYWLDISTIEKPHDLELLILEIDAIDDVDIKSERLDELWDSLKINAMIPFSVEDSVYLLYKGSANSVSWAGDFSGWSPNNPAFKGSMIGNSGVWVSKNTFPSDARLDYKIVKNSSSWILDPANPYRQMSGFGSNSELRMPDWQVDPYTIEDASIDAGTLSSWEVISSSNLSYDIQYKVYTPFNYESVENLPVIYISDGHEYSNKAMGTVTVVLDNLIANNIIEPIIAVFIDPRNPANTNENRRMSEYEGNDNYVSFVADELVTLIDANYKTNASADNRMILGTSMGGLNSAYFGVTRSDVFGCIAIQSPAFQQNTNIYSLYENSAKLPLKIFMSTGVIYDTQDYARQMKGIFDAKAYDLKYIEVNEGHSWGNWRQLIDEAVIYFFGR